MSLMQAQIITTIAGNGIGGFTGDSGQATAAELNEPSGIIIGPSGNICFSDGDNKRIRMINSAGIISTIGGTGIAGYSGDGGNATAATINSPIGISCDAMGNLYFADWGNTCIRKISTAGIITTVAGSGTNTANGIPATTAALGFPYDVSIDKVGNMYIADESGQTIHMVNASGIITVVAGNGFNGFSGDGGQATAAKLFNPFGIAIDDNGNFYIADCNDLIRKVNTSGIIISIAGDTVGAGTNSNSGYGGDGIPAISSKLNLPTGVIFDAEGNLFIGDRSNNRVRKITTSGIISTIAGNGTGGFSGDGGLATAAELFDPIDIAFDSIGNLFIADSENNRIRKVTNVGNMLKVNSMSICIGKTATLTANGASSYSWAPSTYLNTTSGNTVISSSPTSITYTVTGTSNGVSKNVIAVLTVNPLPTIAVSNATICVGDTAKLVANGARTYTWSLSNTLSGNSGANVNALPTSTTNYTVSGTDNNGCVNETSFTIVVNAKPTITTNSISPNCTPLCVTFTTVTNPATQCFTWDFGNGQDTFTLVTPVTQFTSANCFTVVGTQTVTLKVKDINNCISTFTNVVVVYPLPVANFNYSLQLTNTLQFNVQFSNQSIGNISNYWNFENTNSLNDTSLFINPSYTYQNMGTYSVTLIVTSTNGCTSKVVKPVIVEYVIIPNIFTPNGDNINDEFFIQVGNITNFTCKIYDRWGLLIYELNENNKNWNGKSRDGSNASDGSYFYLITYLDTSGKVINKECFIQLSR